MKINEQVFIKLRSPLKLMYITNNPDVAKIAENNTVDRIWVDLETHGKQERQGHVNSVKSNHLISDISTIRNTISKAELLVRVNPLYEGSQAEVDEVVARGADIIMLPMFNTADDAKRFVEIVNGRAKVLLLVETIDAEKNIDEIASVPGVNEIHIGLNDLHLAYNMKFMFELLANGQVEALTKAIDMHGLLYGFGGIAGLDEGILPARSIIAEHYRLGSSMVILSRSFCDMSKGLGLEDVNEKFSLGVANIRSYEQLLLTKSEDFFLNNQSFLKNCVSKIISVE